MWTGEYIQKLDNKGRVVVPQKFRGSLGDVFCITKSLDGCLSIYDKTEWDKFEEEIAKLPYSDKRARDIKRFTLGSKEELEIDKQGRILIPLTLRNSSHMVEDIIFLGVGDHIEVWSKEDFDEKCNFEDSDSLAEELDGLWKDLRDNV